MNNAGSQEVEAVINFNRALADFRENIRNTETDSTTRKKYFKDLQIAFANLIKVKPFLGKPKVYKTIANIYHVLNSLKNNNEQNNVEKRRQIETQLDELNTIHIINTSSHGGRRRSTRRRSTRRRRSQRRR